MSSLVFVRAGVTASVSCALLLATSGRAQAAMSFSVYTDAVQSLNRVQVFSTVIDGSSGCSHWGYMTTASIRTPSNRSASTSNFGLQSNTSIAINAEYGNYVATTSGSYSCSCIFGGTASFGGGRTVTVQKPTSLKMYNSGSLGGTPQQCSAFSPPNVRYYRYRDYQVQDQNSQPILRKLQMQESFTTSQNTCNVSFVQGSTVTGDSGQFRDTFFMCGPVAACNNGGSCTTVRNQTWRADGNTVGQYAITYTCSTVTVSP